jgi:hypothetical protein
MSALEQAIEQWRREGINLLPPSDETTVIDALNRAGRKYSRDVIALYSATGGMKDGECDSHLLSLWPLERVISETVRHNHSHILFADFLIDSHFYCFKYESNQFSSVCIEYFDGKQPERVAETVDEFFELYLRTPNALAMFEE